MPRIAGGGAAAAAGDARAGLSRVLLVRAASVHAAALCSHHLQVQGATWRLLARMALCRAEPQVRLQSDGRE